MTILDFVVGFIAGELIAGFVFYLLGQYVSKHMEPRK